MKLVSRMYGELTRDELYAILDARNRVFVEEQACAYRDTDEKDRQALHVWLEDEEGIAAYARVMPKGVSFPEVTVGRVLTLRRGMGYGKRIMEEALRLARDRFSADTVTIEAQVYAKGFYEKLGFRAVSDEYLDTGIPHVTMKRDRPLTRDEMISVIGGKGRAYRTPLAIRFWTDPGKFSDPAPVKKVLDAFPEDIQRVDFHIPDVYDAPKDDPSWCWSPMGTRRPAGTYDNAGFITDPEREMPRVLADFPSPDRDDLFAGGPAPDGRYRLGVWWYGLFERFWSMRGMENALTDFYEYPDETHALFEKLTDFYIRMAERARAEQHVDGVFTSDDLGTQTGTFFGLNIFDEFFYPCYKRLIDSVHELGMHFWLHTCGNIEAFLPRYIDMGVDVLHPIQKYTMDEKHIAEKYGGRICVWAGFDVQRTIPVGTPDDVRKEVRFLTDTWQRPEGRYILTLGNNATPDTPRESLEALLDEAVTYGRTP